MICIICNISFNDYEIWDLDANLKAVAYICKDCFIAEINTWDLQHGEKHNLKITDDIIFVDTKQSEAKT